MTDMQTFSELMRQRLQFLYGDQADDCLAKLLALLKGKGQQPVSQRPLPSWDQRDVVLITYGDQVQQTGESPLKTLRSFLQGHQLDKLLSTVHILPFSPYSSDDGFSVIDYRQVDPDLGSWEDIRELAQCVDLMFDLVLNHVSAQSLWFWDYLQGESPYVNYFIEVDPDTDVSNVTRPRSLPLLTEVTTASGQRHVWTTFSADQVDLNFSNPAVLLEMIDILLYYAQQGARFIRLDAIAFLWKQIGTTCIHLPQTHEVVKLLRDVLDASVLDASVLDASVLDASTAGCILLTETNVPHAENVSYFGDGDEAHMVYQFSLPPLLLEAFTSQQTDALQSWLLDLEPCRPGTTYFNFTASHDGIGVRPLEGLISNERLQALAEAMRQRGGRISTKRDASGADSPYELNITYFDALGDPHGTPSIQIQKFLASQAIMLALRGIPGVYFHSLVGTPNDQAGVAASGQPRRINRRKFRLDELNELLQGNSTEHQVFAGYCHLLATRIGTPAFHPEASQTIWPIEEPGWLGFERLAADQPAVSCITNFDQHPRKLDISPYSTRSWGPDLITGKMPMSGNTLELAAFQTVWLLETT